MRAVLLSDPQVSEFLAKEVVPCWESVRPVPKVTVDFGDGRVLKRTLQGNTVMYLCLPDGRVVDVLPGVYTPPDFLNEMKKALDFLHVDGGLPTPDRVRAWHEADIVKTVPNRTVSVTISKMPVEGPLIKKLGASPRALPPPGPASPQALADLKARFTAISARIEDVSKRPISLEQLRQPYAGLPPDQQPTPEQLGKMWVTLDSRNNVEVVHPIVHLLLATYEALPTPHECRDVIFKQILHVPIDDPYLGMAGMLLPGTPVGP